MDHSGLEEGDAYRRDAATLHLTRREKKAPARMQATDFDNPAFLDRLRQGEPTAYRALIRRFHTSLTGVAASVIGSRAQAEEVVQDAWLAVFSGIGRFEGRSSLTTWIFSIVLNRARTRAGREKRLVGLPSVLDGTAPGERAVPAEAFKADGHWVDIPRLWDEVDPERIVGGRQLWDHVQEIVDTLPAGQRAVIILRDMEGCPAEEICELLQISPENQRVLLHRARGRVRQAIDSLTGQTQAATDRPASRTPARRSRRPTSVKDLWAPLDHWLGAAIRGLIQVSTLRTMLDASTR